MAMTRHGMLTAISREFAFTSRHNVVFSGLLAAVMCGAVSWVLGQDANWDLRNYHLYAAYAWLHDRVTVDLAPVGLQSYFPPLAELPYYAMSFALPPRLTAFLMGLWQGVSFILLAGLAWRVLANDARRPVLAPMLALAGTVSATFLATLGNGMGDAGTAPWVLFALYLALGESADRRISWLTAGAGLCIGLAVALKLTNAVYAIALAAAVLSQAGPGRQRLLRVLVIALIALAMFALICGPWFMKMWNVYGNPLLPQFNHWFQSPFAGQTSIADQRWLPRSWSERALWPVIMMFRPNRVSEASMLQLVWPLLQIALACWLVRWGMARMGRARIAALSAQQRSVLVFVGVAFVCWMLVFSIHRYLVVAEMVAPLALWLLITSAFTGQLGGRLARIAVTLCALIALGAWNGWGHVGYTRQPYRVEAPEAGVPAAATVLMTVQQPQGWMIPLLPAQYRFVGMSPVFPQGPAYMERARLIWNSTPGRVFVIVPAEGDSRRMRAQRIDRMLEHLHLANSCAGKRRWAKLFKLEVVERNGECALAVRTDRSVDVPAEDARLVQEAATLLSTKSIVLDVTSCQHKQAWIGDRFQPYQWCRVSVS